MCAVQQNLPYEQRVNTTLERMQKKASRQCFLQHSPANDVLNEEAQVRERFYWKGNWNYFRKRYLTNVCQEKIGEKICSWYQVGEVVKDLSRK